MESIIDLDDRQTWPGPIAEYVNHWAEANAGCGTYADSVRIPDDATDTFLGMLRGHRLRAYHCTRLLDHERQVIRSRGLRLASPELIADRLRAALANGDIDEGDHELLAHRNAFAWDNPDEPSWRLKQIEARKNQVCLFFSRQMFDHGSHGLHPLLTNWGGEIVYHTLRDAPRVLSIGRPSVVVALVDIANAKRTPPPIDQHMVAIALGLEHVGCEMFHAAPIAPEHVEAIWQPGDAEYDRFAGLP